MAHMVEQTDRELMKKTNGLRYLLSQTMDMNSHTGPELTSKNSSSNETFVYIQTDANITAHFQAVSGVEGSNEIEEGWWDNPWFGFYWKINDTTWAFHEHLGWINIRSENDESTWVWVDKLGQWYWTAKQHYPYMQAGDGDMSWIWINLEKSNPYKLIYYDYGENAGWKQK